MKTDELVFEVGSVVDCVYAREGEDSLRVLLRLATGREFTLLLTERALFELRSGLAALSQNAAGSVTHDERRRPSYQ